MKNVTYVSLDKNAITNGVGGKSHIIGILKVLSKNFKVGFWSYRVDLLKDQFESVDFLELSDFSYVSVLLNLINDRDTDVFLFRKTILSMYLLLPVIIYKKIFRKKQKFMIEFNGISGDYTDKPLVFSKIMLLINVLPLYFYDGVYCVLDDIADRLRSIYYSDKIFVCRNGGPDNSSLFPTTIETSNVTIIYFGSDLPHYHLQWCASIIDDFNDLNDVNIELFLIGPNNEKVNGDCVRSLPSCSIEDFQMTVSKLDGKVFGLIPLNLTKSSSTIEPIKTFDYFSANIPIIHSDSCLDGFESHHLCFSYQTGNKNSFYKILAKVSNMKNTELLALYKSVNSSYCNYTWHCRLERLVKFINV